MSNEFSRRDILKALGVVAGSAVIPSFAGAKERMEKLELAANPLHKQLDKPVTVITIGAGARGNIYGDFAAEYPDKMDIIGVAEPIAIRNERYAKKHNIPEGNRFKTWEDVFKQPKFADAVIISTPDNLHYAPCMAALKAGYDILLEKPISPSEKECRDILQLAKKTGRIVAVCHVLRYAPYFMRLRELMQSGAIGEVVSIQHFEPIQHAHMAHSYVRGNWHNSKESTPIILAKSCHDLDIIKWMLGKRAQKIQAFGNLKWFKKENAPSGSTERCTDGCAVEKNCPYSAIRIYFEERQRQYAFDLPDDKEKHGEAIMNYLRTGNYGRCVYKMDNDQCDHYVTNMLFEDGITASFSMEAFTPWGDRRTRVMGSMGYIEGDMEKYTIYDFRTKQSKTVDAKTVEVENYKNEGHGGGDWRLVDDWLQAVAQQNPALLTSTIDASIESHVMGFMAEKSRKNNSVQNIKL
jgi:predicted dehydrogenase